MFILDVFYIFKNIPSSYIHLPYVPSRLGGCSACTRNRCGTHPTTEPLSSLKNHPDTKGDPESSFCVLCNTIASDTWPFLQKFRSAHTATQQNVDGKEQLRVKDLLKVPTLPQWRRIEPILSTLQVERFIHLNIFNCSYY